MRLGDLALDKDRPPQELEGYAHLGQHRGIGRNEAQRQRGRDAAGKCAAGAVVVGGGDF